MKKMTKWRMAAVAIAAVSCISVAGNVMAFNESYPYSLGPNETKVITRFVPGNSTIYLNTRPQNGDYLKVTLSGAASGSYTFPRQVPVPDWEVSVPRPNDYLTVTGQAGSSGASGSLRIQSR